MSNYHLVNNPACINAYKRHFPVSQPKLDKRGIARCSLLARTGGFRLELWTKGLFEHPHVGKVGFLPLQTQDLRTELFVGGMLIKILNY